MASNFLNVQTSSPFPNPPDYANLYTTENIRNQRQPKPPPPLKKFSAFGEEVDLEGRLIPSLNDVGLQQMYSSSANWKLELKKLNRSVIAAFLDLVEILIKCPDNTERLDKVETIRVLFINMHHLINEHRPVQARDTIRHMMVKQNKETKAVTEKLRDYISIANDAFHQLFGSFKNADYDQKLPIPPAAYSDPPEYRSMSVLCKKNLRVKPELARKHEFNMQTETIRRHLNLLQLGECDELYNENFLEFELEGVSTKNADEQNDSRESDEKDNEAADVAENDEEMSSSGGSSDETEGEEIGDAAVVEYMDDSDDDDNFDDDMVDVSDEMPEVDASSPLDTLPKTEVEPTAFVEAPMQFVDDTVQEDTIVAATDAISQQPMSADSASSARPSSNSSTHS